MIFCSICIFLSEHEATTKKLSKETVFNTYHDLEIHICT